MSNKFSVSGVGFCFLHYLCSTSYFLAKYNGTNRYWLDIDKLSPTERAKIDEAINSSQSFRKRDAAWQALNRGIIDIEETKNLDLSSLPSPTVEEEYRFLRRWFNPIWLCYTFFLRIVTLHNPVVEAHGFIKSFKVKRVNLYGQYIERSDFDTFNSKLVQSEPFVSVVIPTLNRYDYLYDVMRDLEQQNYKNFEVIVADQSEPVDISFYEQFDLDLTLIQQKEKALWLARNTCIKRSKGDYLLLYDDDSRVDPDWIQQHLKCLDYFQVNISSGVSLSVIGGKIPSDYRYFRWSGQIDTGNVMLRKDVFHKVGLFDRQFEKQRMGDGEFGLRCHINDLKNISNPRAKRVHLKAGKGGLRQIGSWDGFRPKGWLAPRPVPSVLYLCRSYFGDRASLLMLLRSVPPSIIPYQFKSNKLFLIIGWIISIFLLPLIAYQVISSWKRSSRMITEGPKIQSL